MKIDRFKYCRLETADGMAIITIDRPEVLNALHLDAHKELSAAFDFFDSDRSLRVCIITGAGDRSFCVGTDLKSLAVTGPYEYPRSGFGGITKRFDFWKPVIAAINGLCLGGGAEILAACDLAVAAEHAEFSFPEPRIGQAALGGGALQRLPRQMPMKHAMWLALTAQRINATEAQRIGLINQIVPKGELREAAKTIARAILACAPLSIEATKQVMLESVGQPNLEAAMAASYPAAERMLASHDAMEGPLAFAQKRTPQWQGR
jgi:enoyl-CoA hydratase/carnithine racemase